MVVYGVTTCPICGGRFERTNGNQIYCGVTCSLAARKRRQKEYYLRTHDERLRYQRERHELLTGKKVKPMDPDDAARIAVAALTENQKWCLRELLRRIPRAKEVKE